MEEKSLDGKEAEGSGSGEGRGPRYIRYRRDLRNSFMVAEGTPAAADYEEQMLRENRLETLLSFSVVQAENRTQFWYDITGKQSLKDAVAAKGVTAEILLWMLRSLVRAQEELAQYLIAPGHVPLDPELIFVTGDPPRANLLLCYCPLREAEQQPRLLPLANLLICHADARERELCELCYDLHIRAAQSETSVTDLLVMCENRLPQEAAVLVEEGQEYRPLRLTSDGTPVCGRSDAPEAGISAGRHTTGGSDVLFGQPRRAGQSRFPGKREEEASREEKTLWTPENSRGAEIPEDDAKKPLHRIRNWIQGLREKRDGMRREIREENPYPVLVPDMLSDADLPTTLLEVSAQRCLGRLIYEGPGEEPDIHVTGETFAIGSSMQGNDAVLSARTVSRHHARIVLQNGRYFIEDLNSRNGTRVNGQLLEYHQRVSLAAGDRVQFASERYRVE